MRKLETYTRGADGRESVFTYDDGSTVKRHEPARMQRTLAEHWDDIVLGLKLDTKGN